MPLARLKTVIFLAFFLSGCSGLMYQTVWVRMLTRYLGATTYATATVLIVFMAGLALGSYWCSRRADRITKPLQLYALLELLIGVLAVLASFVVINGVGQVYVSMYGQVGNSPATLLATRVVFLLVCLLPPTFLMGTTLPLMVAYITKLGEQFQSSVGWLYAINTYGAVFGVLITGFVLLGWLGEQATLMVAAALNILAGVLAISLVTVKTPAVETAPKSEAKADDFPVYSPGVRKLALLAIFASGLGALAYEILWGRLLVLLLQTSIYAFSIMLGTFLIGIAWGSWDATRQNKLKQTPLASFGFLEVLIGFWAAVGLLLLPYFHQWWQYENVFGIRVPSMVVAAIACIVMVLPVSFCFGLQFPIAVRCCVADPKSPGKSTGWAYTINTLGTIVGSLIAGFLLLPYLGTTKLMLVVAGVNLVLGIVLLLAASSAERGKLLGASFALMAGFIAIVGFIGDPYMEAMTQRVAYHFGNEGKIYKAVEAVTATTVSAGQPNNVTNSSLFINGVGMTVLCTETKLMTHLPLHLAKDPKRMLIICFGMGTTFRSAVKTYPNLHVDVVDIVGEVFECFGFYHKDADEVVKKPNGHRHVDDGRNFLLTHPEKYDVITIDPAPPLHSAGTVNLYTKEFFELCKSRLTETGVLCMWLPYAPESEIKMIMKAYFEVFPQGTLYGSIKYPGFYLTGSPTNIQQTPAAREVMMKKLASIEELGEWSQDYCDPVRLQNIYLGEAADVMKLLGEYTAVTDDKPYTEFPLWREFRHQQGLTEFKPEMLRTQLKNAGISK
jgi:spermidine synthase